MIRTLVLSGGGGRGAFHAGVYRYLMEADKAGIAPTHRGPWIPDIIVGTSIGAVNGAAIAQGIAAPDLEAFWLSLRERDIQGLPPGMGPLARWVVNIIMRNAIGTRLPRIRAQEAFSPPARDSWPPVPILPAWLSERLIGRWNNLLDTGPLYRTLRQRLRLDEARLNDSPITLLISATDVASGQGIIFTNHPKPDPRTGRPRPHVRAPITLRRIIASCSIPVIYPWTRDDDGAVYWDGAVVANTPLGYAFDAVRDRPLDEEMEIIIVMMTPWWEAHEQPPPHAELPHDFGEALTWMLDWALLASFRADLKMIRSYNRIADLEAEAGRAPTRRRVKTIIVAPEQFLPVARIIDYDEPASRVLIRMGYQAMSLAYNRHFADLTPPQQKTTDS